jgi:mannan endo-1,4-beta-mannosidase
MYSLSSAWCRLLTALLIFAVIGGCQKTGVIINPQQSLAAAPMQPEASMGGTDSILKVSGRFLTYPNGDTIILHGVNVPVFHSGWVNDLNSVANAVKSNTRVNTVRMQWYSKKVLATLGNPPYYTNTNLNAALNNYASRNIIPILSLHDLTALNNNTTTGFNTYVTAFWTDTAILSILKKHQNHLIINLENEWGATWAGLTGTTFVNTYGNLIVKLRRAGIKNPIVVDAPDGGANSQFLITNGHALINKDSLKNVVLSVHTYWSQENGAIVNCPDDYTTKIKALYTSGLPFILGEVSDWAVQGSNGQDHESTIPVTFACNGTTSPNKYAVDYDAILTEAVKDKIGFVAWAWYQDGLFVRNIYDQNTGLTINTSAHAGSWPTDMLSNSKVYGLKNPKLNNVH